MMEYKGCGDKAPCILHIETRRRWVVCFMLQPI